MIILMLSCFKELPRLHQLISICTGRTDFDVTTGRLQNQGISREFIATLQTINIAIPQTIVFTQFVMLQYIKITVNCLEITLISQPARSDVKIGPTRAHGNRKHGCESSQFQFYCFCFQLFKRS